MRPSVALIHPTPTRPTSEPIAPAPARPRVADDPPLLRIPIRPPHAPPPSLLRRARSLTYRAIGDLRIDFHPLALLPVGGVAEDWRVSEYRGRPGVIHPPLPLLEPPPSRSSSSATPPSPLRMTADGIRLGIPPPTMVSRNRTGEEVPVVTPPITPLKVIRKQTTRLKIPP